MIRGHFDGASRGNPGQAGAGAVIYEDDRVIWRCARPLGIHTNNEAEYTALGILADELARRGLRSMEICGDSKLVISQVTGVWKIKEPRLRDLAEPVIEKIKALGAKCRWVSRAQNAEADKMSNIALDEGDFCEDLKPVESAASVDKIMPSALVRVEKSSSYDFTKVGEKIWLVRDGADEYAVDMAHRRCTCREGQTGCCRHLKALQSKLPASNDPQGTLSLD